MSFWSTNWPRLRYVSQTHVAPQSVTKFIAKTFMKLVTPKDVTNLEFLIDKPASKADLFNI